MVDKLLTEWLAVEWFVVVEWIVVDAADGGGRGSGRCPDRGAAPCCPRGRGGGFPCQGCFSAGTQQGMSASRTGLVVHIFRTYDLHPEHEKCIHLANVLPILGAKPAMKKVMHFRKQLEAALGFGDGAACWPGRATPSSLGPGAKFFSEEIEAKPLQWTLAIPLKGGSQIKAAAFARRSEMEAFAWMCTDRNIGRVRALAAADRDMPRLEKTFNSLNVIPKPFRGCASSETLVRQVVGR